MHLTFTEVILAITEYLAFIHFLFLLVKLKISLWYVIFIKALNAYINECNPTKDPIFKQSKHFYG